MYSLMNHEMVHVSTNNVSTEEDRRWRRFFLGKVVAQRQNPESMFYSYLTVPRYHGPALVARGQRRLHGNVDGRRTGTRARRLRRDGFPGHGARQRPFLRSAGPRVARHADRFPDRGERLSLRHAFLHLACLHSIRPRRSSQGCRRDEGSERYWSDQFEQVFGMPVEQAWQDWITVRARVPAHEPCRGAQVSDHAAPQPGRHRGGVGVAHVLRRGDRDSVRRLPLSRYRRIHRRAQHARRQRATPRRHQAGDALPGHLVRVRPRRAVPRFTPTTIAGCSRFAT